MEKDLLEELRVARHAYEISHVNFFNTGKITEEERYYATRINDDYSLSAFELIKDYLLSAAKSYSRDCDFDRIDLSLLIGLVFEKENVDDNNKIKENAEPIHNMVRYYIGNATAYLDGEKSNESDYSGVSYQGYINYNKLVSFTKKIGLEFNGPDSFEEFKKAILSGEPFDISLTANLEEREKETKLKRNR